jgi:hypothetical protein
MTRSREGDDVVTLTDCVAATSQEEHDNAIIAYDYPMFSLPMSSKEFLHELGGAPTEDTGRGY